MSIVSTMNVIVFGASEGGRRALAQLRADASVDVVAFADNAQDRQGARFEGLPIIAPTTITARDYDRIVVASHGWKQIVPQLRELGVPADRIEVFRLSDDTFQSLAAPASAFPRVLLLTDDCIAPSHGTGALLIRHFADYPREQIVHGYLWQRGEAVFPHSYQVAVGAGEGGPLSAARLLAQIEARHGRVDVVYSNFYGDNGLAFLTELAGALDPSVPIIHHALDFLVRDEQQFDRLLHGLAPRLSRLWAIGPNLAGRMARVTGTKVDVVNPFAAKLSPAWKTEHRDLDARFMAVAIGNVYTPAVFAQLKTVWADVRRQTGVGPIRWFAHPNTAVQLEQAGVSVDPDIEYCGFAVNNFLHEQLCAADLAIVPFNITDEPDGPIARYSIPSRLTEYMNAGLPIFAAAGTGTDACRFMTGNRIALCSTLADRSRFAAELVGFMRSTTMRRAMGESARRYATQHCDIEQYRARLFGEFKALSGFVGTGTPVQIAAPVAAPAPVEAPVEMPQERLARMMSDKAHYACGRRVIDGWLNIDMFDEAYPGGRPDDELRDRIFYADLRAPHPFADNTFQFAYCEDFLEHVTQADSIIFLSEVYRTLRKGGVARISTPGLPGILRRHLRSSDHAGGATCRAEAYTHWHHLHFYCFESLEIVARRIGFTGVVKCEYGKSMHPELAQDSRPDQADLNLVVELTK